MKKILLGSIAAIFAVAGFTSFKATKSSTNWVYFPTTATAHLPKRVKPVNVLNSILLHGSVNVWVSAPGVKPPLRCRDSSFLCYAAFPSTAVAVTASGNYYLKTAGVGGINAVSFAYTKN